MWDRDPRERLIELLRHDRVVLLVGAGTSRGLGYPDFKGLAREMGVELLADSSWDEKSSPADRIDEIRIILKGQKREDDYFAYLYETFSPRETPHDSLHLDLMRMPFCGVVTTNYESVLESAGTELDYPKHRTVCGTLDLCSDDKYRIFEFLRGLGGSRTVPRDVLHLHGFHKHPRNLILTTEDFKQNYGGAMSSDSTDVSSNNALIELHTKVLWAILAMYPVLFVGFSLGDIVFQKILEVIQSDFARGSNLSHFSLVGTTDDLDEDKRVRELRERGISALTYRVFESELTREDHSNLNVLIRELSDDLVTQAGASPLQEFSRWALNT